MSGEAIGNDNIRLAWLAQRLGAAWHRVQAVWP